VELRRWVGDRLSMGLGPRVIGLAVVIALVAGGLVGGLVIQSARSTVRKDVLERNLGTADLAGTLVVTYIEGAEASLHQLALRQLFLTAVLGQDLEQAEWHMEQVMQIDPRFDNIAVYAVDGTGWASGLKSSWQNRGGSVADRQWFQQTIATGAPYLGIPVLSRGTGHPVDTYTIPIFDDNKKLRAVLAGGISLASLADEITGIRVSESTRASLLDSRQGGIVVADVDPARILQPVAGQDVASAQALAGKRGTIQTRSSSGETDLAAFAPVPRLPWSVLMLEPTRTAFAPVSALTERALLLMGLILLAALILSVLLARRITKPLRRLAEGAAEVGSGNLDYRLGMQARNEIGVAARAFDHMTEELKTTLVSRDDLADEVAERTRAEGELRETNEYLDNLIDRANAPIIVWNPEFRITRFNRAFESLTGRNAGAVIGESLDILFPPAHVVVSMELIRKTLIGERWEAVEIPILHLDGSVRTVLWNSATIFAPDGTTPVATIAQGQDITDLRSRERELEDKNAELERFAYTTSHDLRSPLVTIKTFLGYLAQDLEASDAGRIGRDLNYMHGAADKMGQLLDELLEMSRLGRVANPSSAATFEELVREAVNMLAGSIAERRVDVCIGDAEVALFGDRPRLVEIWQNLIENAVKFMGSQPAPRVDVGAQRVDGETRFFVRDNGIGIDPRHQSKAFGLFEKLDPQSQGTGIGLALVRRIVELNRGRIWVESQGQGQGASFWFTLPAAVQDELKGGNA
jgi:PAS domain S-box-containing protein